MIVSKLVRTQNFSRCRYTQTQSQGQKHIGTCDMQMPTKQTKGITYELTLQKFIHNLNFI